eukprot:jgi/Chlat1/6888/Chrsp51S06555
MSEGALMQRAVAKLMSPAMHMSSAVRSTQPCTALRLRCMAVQTQAAPARLHTVRAQQPSRHALAMNLPRMKSPFLGTALNYSRSNAVSFSPATLSVRSPVRCMASGSGRESPQEYLSRVLRNTGRAIRENSVLSSLAFGAAAVAGTVLFLSSFAFFVGIGVILLLVGAVSYGLLRLTGRRLVTPGSALDELLKQTQQQQRAASSLSQLQRMQQMQQQQQRQQQAGPLSRYPEDIVGGSGSIFDLASQVLSQAAPIESSNVVYTKAKELLLRSPEAARVLGSSLATAPPHSTMQSNSMFSSGGVGKATTSVTMAFRVQGQHGVGAVTVVGEGTQAANYSIKTCILETDTGRRVDLLSGSGGAYEDVIDAEVIEAEVIDEEPRRRR